MIWAPKSTDDYYNDGVSRVQLPFQSSDANTFDNMCVPCRVGLVVSVSASRTVGREFASRHGHTYIKDHHKNGTDCLPPWHAMR